MQGQPEHGWQGETGRAEESGRDLKELCEEPAAVRSGATSAGGTTKREGKLKGGKGGRREGRVKLEGQQMWTLSGFILKTWVVWQGFEQVSNLTCALINITCLLCGQCFLVRREKKEGSLLGIVMEISHGTQRLTRRFSNTSGQVSARFYFVPSSVTHSCVIIYKTHFTDVDIEVKVAEPVLKARLST